MPTTLVVEAPTPATVPAASTRRHNLRYVAGKVLASIGSLFFVAVFFTAYAWARQRHAATQVAA